MAGSDLAQIKSHPKVRVQAIAEIDPVRRGQCEQRFKNVKVYADWRENAGSGRQESRLRKCIHPRSHACRHGDVRHANGTSSLRTKPLTHDVAESRVLAEYAKANRLVTQMGIQIHSSKQYRTAAVGSRRGDWQIKEAHSFSGKRWGDSNPKPPGEDPIPEGLDWDAWIGPAPFTKYLKSYYHPGQWRKRLDYGTGTFGDMGCHIYDPTFQSPWFDLPDLPPIRRAKTQPGQLGIRCKNSLSLSFHPLFRGRYLTRHLVRRFRQASSGGDLFARRKKTTRSRVGDHWYQGNDATSSRWNALPLSPKEVRGFENQGSRRLQSLARVRRCGLGERPHALRQLRLFGTSFRNRPLGRDRHCFPQETLIWDAPKLSFKGNSKATALVSKATERVGVKGLG